MIGVRGNGAQGVDHPSPQTYLLGLLAMIKCSICSYQCDNWYDSNMSLCLSHYFFRGSVHLSLLGGLQVLPWHRTQPGAAHPLGLHFAKKIKFSIVSDAHHAADGLLEQNTSLMPSGLFLFSSAYMTTPTFHVCNWVVHSAFFLIMQVLVLNEIRL